MPKSNRLLALLKLLQESTYLSSTELARLCGISERGVYRYINTLTQAGINVQHSNKGYYIKKPRSQATSPEYLGNIRDLLQIGLQHCHSKAIAKAGRQEVAHINTILQCSNHQSADLVIGHGIRPSELVPLETYHTIAMDIMPLVYSSLVTVDSQGQARPCLAVSWKQVGDCMSFVMREDATFANGENIKAQNIVNTYTQAMTSDHLQHKLDMVEDVNVAAEYVVEFHVKHLACMYPFALPVSNGSASGAYYVQQWGDEIKLEANASYFGPSPAYEKLTFRYIEKPADVLQAISDGTLDVALDLLAADVYCFVNRHFHVYPIDDGKYYTVFFNVDKIEKQLRIALRMMIDKKAIKKKQLKSRGEYLNGPFMECYSDKDVPVHDYAPDEAVAMLKALGWRSDSAGWLKKDGRRLTITLGLLEQTHIVKRLAIALRVQLGACGVDVEICDGEVDAYIGCCCFGCGPLFSRGVWQSGSADNISRYSNEEVDKLWAEASKADSERIKAICKAIHQAIYRDCPAVFLTTSTIYLGSNRLLPEGVQSVSDFLGLLGRPGRAEDRNANQDNLAAIV